MKSDPNYSQLTAEELFSIASGGPNHGRTYGFGSVYQTATTKRVRANNYADDEALCGPNPDVGFSITPAMEAKIVEKCAEVVVDKFLNHFDPNNSTMARIMSCITTNPGQVSLLILCINPSQIAIFNNRVTNKFSISQLGSKQIHLCCRPHNGTSKVIQGQTW